MARQRAQGAKNFCCAKLTAFHVFAFLLAHTAKPCGLRATRQPAGRPKNTGGLSWKPSTTAQSEASARFLTSKGYEILDRSWTAADGQAIDIIAKDDDGIAFVNVSANVGTQRFEDPTITREQRESAAAQWLAANGDDLVDIAVRFDDIALMIVSGSRAILRHHVNALAPWRANQTS